MIYASEEEEATTLNIDTPQKQQEQFVLADDEVITLGKWALLIEEHYQKPMDIEWAKDGISNELFITQARPETVHHSKNKNTHIEYRLLERGKVCVQGNAVGSKIKTGEAVLLNSPKEATNLDLNSIIVTDTITQDWDPLLKQVGGIITNKGGRTSHAAIVARELGVPAIVGCGNAKQTIANGIKPTMSCAEGKTGYIYEGHLKYEEQKIDFSGIEIPSTKAKFILADPESAFQLSFYPNDGVGLLRMEFIITHLVQIHPLALVNFNALKDVSAKRKIEELTKGYE